MSWWLHELLQLLYLVHSIVVCGHTGVVDCAEPDNYWIPDAALHRSTKHQYSWFTLDCKVYSTAMQRCTG